MTWSILDTKTSTGVAVSSVSAVFDSAPVSGNLILISVAVNVAAATFTPPSGFSGRSFSASSRTIGVYYKVADGTEAATQTVSSSASGNMLIVARCVQKTGGAGTQSLILGSIGFRSTDDNLQTFLTNEFVAQPNSYLFATAYSTNALSSWSSGYGSQSTATVSGLNLHSAFKDSPDSADSLTVTFGTNTQRGTVIVFELLDPSQQSAKVAAVDINSSGSGVKADGLYYNDLRAHPTATSISNARNIYNTADTGFTFTVNNAFGSASTTGTAYTGQYLASDVMNRYATLSTSGDNAAQITIGGLDNNKKYAITFGGHTGLTTIPLDITIGGVTRSLRADVTVPNLRFAGFANVTPSGGNVVVNFAGNGSGTSALSAILISEIEPTSATISSGTPSGTIGTQRRATLGATSTATSGTFYGVLSSSQGDITGISAAQVFAAQYAGGGAATFSGNAAVSDATPELLITGLSPNTTYYYAVMHRVGTSNSNVVTGSFTTAVATQTATLTLVDGNNAALNAQTLNFWTRTTLNGAAVDGGSNGLSVTSNGSGVFSFSGLTIGAGAGFITVQNPNDNTFSANYPVTFVAGD